MRPTLVLVSLLALFGCGGGGDDDADDGDPGGSDGGGGDEADASPDGWQTLIEGEWTLEGLDEGYFCVYATVPRDTYVKAFRPLIPIGTHHTVLTMYEGSEPDGTERCTAGTNGQNMIYGSGVGSPDFVFPDGVGLHLEAGDRLLLNLHLYNAGDDPLSGRSGALIQEATAGEIENEAELVLAGPTLGLTVPTGTTTQSGDCNLGSVIDEPVQVFALSQHMHKLGRHMRSVIVRGDDEIVLQDVGYDFENQLFHQVSPFIELLPGDVLRTECTYENTAQTNPPDGAEVGWGDSSDQEMCFTDVFYFPAQGAGFICTF
jgi:hypothetical protein